MVEELQPYEIIFAQEGDEPLLLMAASIINSYAEQGLMLSVTLEKLQQIAAQGMLALAITDDHQAIGTAGIMYEYPDGKKEFGGWAVKSEWIHSGVGKQLLRALLGKNSDKTVIAFANHNSGPIFEKLGAEVLDQRQMPRSAFELCQTCQCKNKAAIPSGQYCVDTIFDLTPLLKGNV